MSFVWKAIACFAALAASTTLHAEEPVPTAKWSIAIHGGAGTLTRERMTPEKEAAYRAALQVALDAGSAVLKGGGTAADAVTAVITRLEDDPKFNAGRGAVFTWDGTNEMDASIMLGETRAAGAVAGVGTVRHPILLARAVMEHSPHVFLSGKGAEQFAAQQGLEIVGPEWFATDDRKRQLEQMKAKNLTALDVEFKFGTVGAVALDEHGHLAAGTSTGGMTGKRWGRIGDSPVIGAGTWADDRACAVSGTGWGEYFIRVGVAHEICDRMLLAGEDAQTAADKVIGEVATMGGDGGVIVVSKDGDAVFSMNTPGMYRGRATSSGTNEVAIFADEDE
ncbi:isoaspartyl peptidase/L-asparaginase [Altererythrobacter sp. FM1]|uniref:isoaspartyl peptidase/L-asparaginase family protein n=1 Tax=Tsuneonella flava TaxID=2055955 RepID=UPI000C802FE9|nr:isoaspartyl peptidase/L-asparaginase [Altererythrobacter sp. FM1]